jgi:hypothetical protein
VVKRLLEMRERKRGDITADEDDACCAASQEIVEYIVLSFA